MSLRVSFLVDGFNLYHSLKDAQRKTGKCCKWLNIRALCESYLPAFGKQARLEAVLYFSAYATHCVHRDPGVVARHQILVRALESTGVRPEMGHFKPKDVRCKLCGRSSIHHEEKETDVALAVRLVELVVGDLCDIAVVVTGDTDIAPGIRTAKRLATTKLVGVIAPYKRANAELKQISDHYFKLQAESYESFLFPDEILLPSGRKLTKPVTW